MRSELIKKSKLLGYLFCLMLFITGWVCVVISQKIDISIAMNNTILYFGVFCFVMVFANYMLVIRAFLFKGCYIASFVIGIIFCPVIGIGVLNIFSSIYAKKVLTNDVQYKVSNYKYNAKATLKSMITFTVLRYVAFIMAYVVFGTYLSKFATYNDEALTKVSLMDYVMNNHALPIVVIAYLVSIFALVFLTGCTIFFSIDLGFKRKTKDRQHKTVYICGFMFLISALLFFIPWYQSGFAKTNNKILTLEDESMVVSTENLLKYLVLSIELFIGGAVSIVAGRLGIEKHYSLGDYIKPKKTEEAPKRKRKR